MAENGGVNGKGVALYNLALRRYRSGKSLLEGFEYFQKAAELDNAHSCGVLALLYCRGNYKGMKQVERSLEKAKEWAQRGFEQGNCGGHNSILAKLYRNEGDMNAAYQEDPGAMYDLVKYYLSKHETNNEASLLAIH